MAAPTFVQSVESPTWDENGSLTRDVTITVTTGNRLVMVASTEDNGFTLSITNAGGQTWTAGTGSPTTTASRCKAYAWTATSVTTGAISLRLTCSNVQAFGFEVYEFSGSDGFGNSNSFTGSTDDPSFSLTTTQANSAIVCLRTDWNASATATTGAGGPTTYRTGAGAFTEQTYFRNSARYTTANGYHADAGTAAAKTLGHTTTGTITEAYANVAVEVKGTAGGGGAVTVKQLSALGVG